MTQRLNGEVQLFVRYVHGALYWCAIDRRVRAVRTSLWQVGRLTVPAEQAAADIQQQHAYTPLLPLVLAEPQAARGVIQILGNSVAMILSGHLPQGFARQSLQAAVFTIDHYATLTPVQLAGIQDTAEHLLAQEPDCHPWLIELLRASVFPAIVTLGNHLALQAMIPAADAKVPALRPARCCL